MADCRAMTGQALQDRPYSDAHHLRDFREFLRFEEEWLQLKLLEEFLEPFYEATNFLSATDFPTSNHRDLILFELKEHLESQINNELLGTMKKRC